MKAAVLKKILVIIFVLSFGFLFGCAGFQWVPAKGGLIPVELLEADKAIEQARLAGKDKKCPEEFNAVKDMVCKAYSIYWSCRTFDAIDVAKEATKKAETICPAKSEPSPQPSPPPPPPSSPPPPPVKKEVQKVIDRMTLLVNFDFDKALIRKGDGANLQKALDFVMKYPNSQIVIEGHTCNIGAESYNQTLSERRAQAVKKYLVEKGRINESRIKTVGYGERKPAKSNETRQGRVQNRRAEILILSE